MCVLGTFIGLYHQISFTYIKKHNIGHKMHVLGIELLILLHVKCISAYERVDQCPNDRNAWIERAGIVNCTNSKGQFYHCIRSTAGDLVELCTLPLAIEPSDGCPILQEGDNRRFISVACPGIQGCPGQHDRTFSSNDLYKYQGCLKSKEAGTSSQVTNIETTVSNTPTESVVQISIIPVLKSTSSQLNSTTNDVLPTENMAFQQVPSYQLLVSIGCGFVVVLSFIAITIRLCRLKRRRTKKEMKRKVVGLPVPEDTYTIYDEVGDVQCSRPLSSASYIEPIDVHCNRSFMGNSTGNVKKIVAQHLSYTCDEPMKLENMEKIHLHHKSYDVIQNTANGHQQNPQLGNLFIDNIKNAERYMSMAIVRKNDGSEFPSAFASSGKTSIINDNKLSIYENQNSEEYEQLNTKSTKEEHRYGTLRIDNYQGFISQK